MLVVARKVSETCIVTYKDPDNPNAKEVKFTVLVVQIKGKQIRLGIDAPKSATIHRGEVQQTIDQKIARIQGGI